MFNVSREFAPPFSLIAPYFWLGSLFFLIADLALLFVDADASRFDLGVVAWAHLFLLGIVMMVIFGAMAQLVPVVLEVGHFSVDFYYLIWPLLGLGTVGMVLGFTVAPGLLPYGGLMVLLAMLIYLADTILTLRKVEHFSLTVKTVAATNIFLLLGILVGFAMALGIGAGVAVAIDTWLGTHIVLVLGGYVTLTIVGMSMILLPMFGLSHGFDEKPVQRAFMLLAASVSLYFLDTLLGAGWFHPLAVLGMMISMGLYLYQVWLINQTRARKEWDIWYRSMVVGYLSLAAALLLGAVGYIGQLEHWTLTAVWFLVMGFFTFLITGHLYKIVPFLVWFERYSPLVGKKRVPMLADMVPVKMADFQFAFSTLGLLSGGLGVLLQNDTLFKAGASFLVVGAIFLLMSMRHMMAFGKEETGD